MIEFTILNLWYGVHRILCLMECPTGYTPLNDDCSICSLVAASSNVSRALLCYSGNTSCSVGCLACFNSTLCLHCGNLSLINGQCVDFSFVAASSNESLIISIVFGSILGMVLISFLVGLAIKKFFMKNNE